MERERSDFVVLRHEIGQRMTRPCATHFDWMFRIGDALRTWATQPLDSFRSPFEVACQSLSDHRLSYLDFEGAIGGDRGRVTRVLAGTFCFIENDHGTFIARLFWDGVTGPVQASVTIYRNFSPDDGSAVDESCDDLRLRFSPGR